MLLLWFLFSETYVSLGFLYFLTIFFISFLEHIAYKVDRIGKLLRQLGVQTMKFEGLVGDILVTIIKLYNSIEFE